MSLEGINWLAVIVSGVLYFILGALWYSPLLFANRFIALRGWTQEQMAATGNDNMLDYALTFIGDLIIALVLAVFIRAAGATTLVDGVLVGLVLALGIAGISTFTYTLFSGPKKGLWVLYTGYQTLTFVIMGGLLALWV